MSLSGDMLVALEALVRAAVPAIPLGARGATRGWVPVDSLAEENFPHLVLWAPSEKTQPLPYRQQRVELGLRLTILRSGDGFDPSLEDWNAIRTQLGLDPTLGGIVDLCELSLDAIEDASPESPFRAVLVSAAAFKEL